MLLNDGKLLPAASDLIFLQIIKMEEPSEVQKIYKNQTILVLGATGFIGKVLIEKLLRSCSDIKMIYILIRTKKNKTLNQRVDELLKSSV